jgi:hypothetical protein
LSDTVAQFVKVFPEADTVTPGFNPHNATLQSFLVAIYVGFFLSGP